MYLSKVTQVILLFCLLQSFLFAQKINIPFLQTNPSSIDAVEFIGDEYLILSEADTLSLWSLESNKKIKTYYPIEEIDNIAVHPNETNFMTFFKNGRDKMLHYWSINTTIAEKVFPIDIDVEDMAYIDESSLILITEKGIFKYDTKFGKLSNWPDIQKYDNYTHAWGYGSFFIPVISDDKKTLIALKYYKDKQTKESDIQYEIQLIDLKTNVLVKSIKLNEKPNLFSIDKGRKYLAYTNKHKIKILDINQNKIINETTFNNKAVKKLEISPDGKYYSISLAEGLKFKYGGNFITNEVRNTQSNKLVYKFETQGKAHELKSKYSPSTNYLFAFQSSSIELLNLNTIEKIPLLINQVELFSLDFLNGNLITTSNNGFQYWDLKNAQLMKAQYFECEDIDYSYSLALAKSKDGQSITSLNANGGIYKWNISTNKINNLGFIANADGFGSYSFFPYDEGFTYWDHKKKVMKYLNLKSKKEHILPTGGDYPQYSKVIDIPGTKKVIISTNKSNKLYDNFGMTHLYDFSFNYMDNIMPISNKGKYIIHNSYPQDGNWPRKLTITNLTNNSSDDIATGYRLLDYRSGMALLESSNGIQVISFGGDKTKKFLMFENDLDKAWIVNKPNDKKIMFNPDYPLLLASTQKDYSVKLWSVNQQDELATLAVFENNEWVIITPEGYYTCSQNAEKYINILSSNVTARSINNTDRKKYFRPDIVKAALLQPLHSDS